MITFFWVLTSCAVPTLSDTALSPDSPYVPQVDDTGPRAWVMDTADPGGYHLLTSSLLNEPSDGHALTELDANLGVAWTHDIQTGGAMGAWRLDNGDTVYTNSGLPPDLYSTVEYLDTGGNLLWSYSDVFLGGAGFSHGVVATAAGDFIVLDTFGSRVVSFDTTGDILWEFETTQDDQASYPNGLGIRTGSDGTERMAITLVEKSSAQGQDQLVMYQMAGRQDPPSELWHITMEDANGERYWPHGPHFQDDDTLLVCLSALGQVRAYDLAGGEIWRAPADGGSATLAFPRDATFLPNGDLVVADAGAELLRIADPLGDLQVTAAVQVSGIFSVRLLVCGDDSQLPCLNQ